MLVHTVMLIPIWNGSYHATFWWLPVKVGHLRNGCKQKVPWVVLNILHDSWFVIWHSGVYSVTYIFMHLSIYLYIWYICVIFLWRRHMISVWSRHMRTCLLSLSLVSLLSYYHIFIRTITLINCILHVSEIAKVWYTLTWWWPFDSDGISS